jgi:hypothetical protein
MKLFASILLVILFCGVADAQSMMSVCADGNCGAVDASNQTGAYEYAVRMNSPPHRRLVSAGLIQDVQCFGSICVGRGTGSASSKSFVAKPIRSLVPLTIIRVRLKRCR